MMNDENTALLNALPELFEAADGKVNGVLKIIENTSNPDNVLKKVVEAAPAFNSAMSLKMAGHGTEIAELVQLHMINRVLSATTPDEDITFSAKWKRVMGSSVPSKRADLFKACAKWWTQTDRIHELSRFTKALSVFELALMSAAPTIFAKDHWIQFVTGEPVQWIPAHHARLLHPNALLKLLRSDLGALCMEQWRQVQWQGDDNTLLDRPTRGRSNGVLTVLRSDFPGFDTVTEVSRLTVPGRYLVVRVMVELVPIYIHNVYAPVDKLEKQSFYSNLATHEFEENATHFVLGDLNTPLDPSLDCSKPDLRYDPSRSSCLDWLARLGVVDAWRIHNDSKRVFTGPMPRKNRLDYILMSTRFCNQFFHDSKYFTPKHAGDHIAHSVSFKSGSQLHGRGYWKFPRYLLEYPQVVSAIAREAEAIRDQLRSVSHPGKLWEQWKKNIRVQLQELQKKLRTQDAQAAALREYKETVTRTSQYSQDTAFDFQAATAEKSTKHFFRPLDSSLRRVSIETVLTPDGSVSTNSHEISLRFLEHWGAEMGDANSPGGDTCPPDAAFQRKLLDSVVRVLPTLDRDILDMEIGAADLELAIKHMKANSSPGMDGLTAAFYQVAPAIFGECLALVFNDRLGRGALLASQRKSAVILLHKKGSCADPGNYRPISLMQVDVKVLSKALTFRLQTVIGKLIHPDQKGFVRGRSIHHHVRFLADLQDFVTRLDEEAYALFLDFQKAFDRVNWDYMFKLL
ncbi:unnamed protein product [Peronospora destructor]|uniref:Reverse transcriptase domain-containing protein n=1 Tax=Peronospora destructor TaxID=86335 RepID=A0AAV0VFI4_9STRA|nr:unnamed protein product [Peronospora destructor]